VLGRFLEYSIPTPDIRASLDFYGSLGFSQAEVGETWPHPYAVVTDGRLHLGLHQQPTPQQTTALNATALNATGRHATAALLAHAPAALPALTFVKADVLHQLGLLESRRVTLEYRKLGNDVFNEIGWLDPSGHLVRLIEARTFSPIKNPRASVCGYFQEIGLPVPDRELAKNYWEELGFVGLDEPDAALAHISCTSDSIDIGLYDPAQLSLPTLVFETDDLAAALAHLASAGIAPSGAVPAALRKRPAAMLAAPEGTRILLLTDD
jgi:catechol 2,3-dioxygenase-like lactoylglutathione lyase family enzyme